MISSTYILGIIIKQSISLGLLYLIFKLFVEKKNSLRGNRGYLLTALILSSLLPFFHFNFELQINNELVSKALQPIHVNSTSQEAFHSNQWLFSRIYFLISLFLLIIFLFRILVIVKHIYSNPKEKSGPYIFIKLKNSNQAFTFLNFIFMPGKNESAQRKQMILQHELTHARQLHTLDLLIAELCGIVFWANPFVWLVKKSMAETHEYIADANVLMNNRQRKAYQELLLEETFLFNKLNLVNHFNQSTLKKRILMMKREQNIKKGTGCMLILLPVVSLLFFAFSIRTESGILNINRPEKQIQEPDTIPVQQEDQTFFIVEEMPVFSKGGKKGLQEYIAKNLKYPKSSKRIGQEGKVYVRFTVEKDGTVSHVKVLRSSGTMLNDKKKTVECDIPDLEEEAVRVIKSLPVFNPGMQKGKAVRVQFNVPIVFKLN